MCERPIPCSALHFTGRVPMQAFDPICVSSAATRVENPVHPSIYGLGVERRENIAFYLMELARALATLSLACELSPYLVPWRCSWPHPYARVESASHTRHPTPSFRLAVPPRRQTERRICDPILAIPSVALPRIALAACMQSRAQRRALIVSNRVSSPGDWTRDT